MVRRKKNYLNKYITFSTVKVNTNLTMQSGNERTQFGV